jgi:hypothetical protein
MLDKIAQIYGVDPSHFRQLLKLDKTVTKRAKGDKQGFANLSYGLACCFHVLMGIPVAFILLSRLLDAPVEAFDYALIALSYTMVMIAFLSYSRLEFIFNPTDYLVLAHTPVSSRTFFLAKLTRLLSSTAVMLGCLNLLPAIAGCWTGGTKSVISNCIPAHLPHRRVFQRWCINGDYRLCGKTKHV